MANNFSGLERAVGEGLIAHLLVFDHFVFRNTMDKLASGGRYADLSMAYEGFISLLAERDHSPGELAGKLGISKQACSKTVRELQQLGFIERRANPQDSRSSLLSLSPGGQQLLQDGIDATNEIHRELAAELGAERLQALIGTLEKLRATLALELQSYHSPAGTAPTGAGPHRLNLLLPALSRHFQQSMRENLLEQGFPNVRPSCGQVLGLIGRDGGRIQYMASVLGISKQAVALSATELETQGYILRETHPTDRRQVILRLSPTGERLIDAAIACASALENRLQELLEPEEFAALESTLEAVYLQLARQYDTQGSLPARIQQLSDHLIEELGVAGARALAQQLMELTRGKS